jgi:hypothetical protein
MYSSSSLADSLSAIQAELRPDEKLLWSGQPPKGIRFRAADFLTIPFSLLWTGFAVFWEANAIALFPFPCFALFGLPFVLAGLYIVLGRFFVDALQRDRMCYGVTNERVVIISELLSKQHMIIISELLGKHVKSLDLRTLQSVRLEKWPDGSGTITFGPAYIPPWRYHILGIGVGRYIPPMFERIPDAKSVYETIREAQQQVLQQVPSA